jgi:hypothetical protein
MSFRALRVSVPSSPHTCLPLPSPDLVATSPKQKKSSESTHCSGYGSEISRQGTTMEHSQAEKDDQGLRRPSLWLEEAEHARQDRRSWLHFCSRSCSTAGPCLRRINQRSQRFLTCSLAQTTVSHLTDTMRRVNQQQVPHRNRCQTAHLSDCALPKRMLLHRSQSSSAPEPPTPPGHGAGK